MGSSPIRTAVPKTISVARRLVSRMREAARGSIVVDGGRVQHRVAARQGFLHRPRHGHIAHDGFDVRHPSGERLRATRSGDRTSSRTVWPRDIRAATEWQPTNPVPPVTSTFTNPTPPCAETARA